MEMQKSQLAKLKDNERLLVKDTSPKAVAALDDEDKALKLHKRVRSARAKYRRAASELKKAKKGKAKEKQRQVMIKLIFVEDALARVSQRVAELAEQTRSDYEERLGDQTPTS